MLILSDVYFHVLEKLVEVRIHISYHPQHLYEEKFELSEIILDKREFNLSVENGMQGKYIKHLTDML